MPSIKWPVLLAVTSLLCFGSSGAVGEAGGTQGGGNGTQRKECHEENRTFDSQVRLAGVEFERVDTIFIVLMFIMVVVLAKMVWHHRLMHIVASNIPESCMLIVVGAHIGGIIIGSFRIDDCNEGKDPPFRFTPDLFFLFLLPPIVLEAGYFINTKAFFGNITTILVYAVIGTIWNTIAVGGTLYALSISRTTILTGNLLSQSEFTISSALLFGTICAAVDPVAVLAVFEDIHVNQLLHILVFGESLLNDAVTIVLFKVLGAFSNRPFDSHLTEENRGVTAGDAFLGVAQFFIVVFASLVIGVSTGMAAAMISRFSSHVHVLEPMIVFVMGYLSYILADMFEFSGIVSLIFCAMVMRHYLEPNLSRKSSTTTKYALKVVSNVSEMIIFLFLGISLYDTSVQNWDWGLSLWTILFSLLYRPIGVVMLTLLVNIFRSKRIGYKSVFVMSYSGLRGAVAFSLALARVNEEDTLTTSTDPKILAEAALRRAMLTAVTLLVLFTVFVQGITIKPLVKLIKVRIASDRKPTMNEVIHGTTIEHMMSGIEGILGYFGHNRLSEKLLAIDQKYLRKIFERYPEAGEEKILHTFNRLQKKESKRAVEKNLVFEYHEVGDDRSESHISLHEDREGEPPNVHDSQLAEDSLPSLNDILAASFAHPHENHFGHVLSCDEREDPEDHHFEPVNYRRDIIRTKHATRKNRKKRRNQLHHLMKAASSFSVDGSRAPPPVDEVDADDVPDVPMPIAEYPDDSSIKQRDDMVVISMEDLNSRQLSEPEPEPTGSIDRVPLSPKSFDAGCKETNV